MTIKSYLLNVLRTLKSLSRNMEGYFRYFKNYQSVGITHGGARRMCDIFLALK